MNKKNVTLDIIAKNLGISKSAVSLSLAGKYGVSEETTRKVLLEAVRLGYKLNSSNISKRRRVAVIVSPHEIRSESFFFEILTGVNKELQKNNIIMDIRILSGQFENVQQGKIEDLLIYLVEHKIDSVIGFSDVGDDVIEALQKLDANMVLVDNRRYHKQDINHIIANNFFGGYLAAEYLVQCGHRDLMFMGAISYSFSFAERYYGFCEYLNQAGIEPRSCISEAEGVSFLLNHSDAVCVLSDKSKLPSAIFCVNDPVAVEVYQICARLGIKVGEDLSVLSFDNTAVCTNLTPKLSSFHIPKEEMGMAAVDMLFQIWKNKESGGVQPARTIQIGTKLVERESVKKLSADN